MIKIQTRSKDIIWNYIGTIVSMSSGFVLLPFLMHFLSGNELGLWYIYIAIANLAMLFEFGFNPTFARNIVYVVSGARKLVSVGRSALTEAAGINWHLLNVVIRASQIIYSFIAVVVLIILSTFGTFYVSFITADEQIVHRWISWVIFCLAIFLNLYFLYSITLLRGYGDIAGENKAKTFAKISQLLVTVILLLFGFGLLGAAIGYLCNAIIMRILTFIFLSSQHEIKYGRACDSKKITFDEIFDVLKSVAHLAWRDGFVQIAFYVSTQAMSILCSFFLSLSETGTYSILLQLVTALYNFATAYPKSFFPAIQSAYAEDNIKRQREISSKGIVAYWILFICGSIGTMFVILPILPLIRSGTTVDYGLYIGLCFYLGLVQQHSIFCNFIISMNEIPYMCGYVVAAVSGIFLTYFFCGFIHLGVWGIVFGQAIPQLVYNNWKWPVYYCKKISIKYPDLIRTGFQLISKDFINRFHVLFSWVGL